MKLELVPVTAPSEPAPAPSKPQSHQRSGDPTRPASQRGNSSSVPADAPSSPEDPVARLDGRLWREWSSFDRTMSFRLPPELLSELEERMWRLRLPRGAVGLTVAAALALLLDESDERVLQLVARAEDSKPRRRHSLPAS